MTEAVISHGAQCGDVVEANDSLGGNATLIRVCVEKKQHDTLRDTDQRANETANGSYQTG